MAYEKVAGPLGGIRADAHAAMVSSWIVNVNRGKGARMRPVEDFMPRWDRRAQMTPEEMFNQVRVINAQMGGTEITQSS